MKPPEGWILYPELGPEHIWWDGIAHNSMRWFCTKCGFYGNMKIRYAEDMIINHHRLCGTPNQQLTLW